MPQRRYKLAKNLKKADWLSCDLGYGAHTHDVFCEVLEVKPGVGLFGNDVIRVKVRISPDENMNHCDLKPTDKVTVRC